MFIVCNEKEYKKKKLKDIPKILISEYLEDIPDSKKVTHLNQFLPPMKLFHDFIDGRINKKKYIKKYKENIKKNEEMYATLIVVMLIYQKKKDICLVCSSNELKSGYMHAFCELLAEEFNIEVVSYKKLKDKMIGKNKYDKNKLNKAIKKYREILEDTGYKKKKKKKKTKDKKKSNKYKVVKKMTAEVVEKPRKHVRIKIRRVK